MAAELAITVEQGASWTRVCALQNAGATAYDLTGCTIEAQARGEFNAGSIPEAQFTVTYSTNRALGLFRLSLDYETTAEQSFRRIMYWDILLTDADGKKVRLIEGGVEVTAQTTLSDVTTAEDAPAAPTGSDTVNITIVLTSPVSATVGTALATDTAAVHYSADSGKTSAEKLQARTNIGAEASLGNPGTTGYVLSSTTAGVRSWVAQSGGGSGTVTVDGANVYLVGGSNAFASATNSFGNLNLDAVSSTIYGPDGLGLYASGGITYMSGGGGALLDLTSSAFTGDWTHSGLLMTISGTTSGGVTMAADAGDTLHEATGWGLNLGIGSNGAVTSYRAGESNWMFALERDYLTTQGVLQHEAYFEDNTAYAAHRPFIAAWSQQFNATVNSITAGVVVLASAPTNNYIRSGLRFKFPTLTGTVSGITANQFYYVKRRISATSFAFSSSVYSSAITFSVASPTQATCSAVAAHGFTNGQTVTIYGVTTGTFSGTVNGQQTITVTGTHTFTIDGLACTVAGSGGTVLGGSGAENTGGATAGGTMQRGGYGAAAFTMPAKVVAYSYDSVDITSVTAFEVNNQVASAATKVLLSNAVSGSAQAFIQTNSTFKFGQGAVYGGSSNSFDISSLNTGTTVDFSMNYTSGWVKMGYTSDASSVAPASRLDVNGTVTATAFSGGGASLTSVNAATVTAADDLTDDSHYMLFADGATGSQAVKTNTGLRYNPVSNVVLIDGDQAAVLPDITGGSRAGSFTTGAFSDTTDASSTTVAGLKTAGGLAVAKKLYVGTSINIPGATSGTATMTAGASNSGFVFSATPFSNSGAYGLIGVGWISGSSNGRFQLTATTATTGAISRLTFGTEDASTPQFRFSGTTITSGLGNATDGGAFVASGTLAVTGATTLTGLLTTNGGISIAGGQNIALSTTTGTKIGTGTTQLLGFYNATPVDQPAAVADITGGAVPQTAAGATDCMDKINLILARLRELGLIAT